MLLVTYVRIKPLPASMGRLDRHRKQAVREEQRGRQEGHRRAAGPKVQQQERRAAVLACIASDVLAARRRHGSARAAAAPAAGQKVRRPGVNDRAASAVSPRLFAFAARVVGTVGGRRRRRRGRSNFRAEGFYARARYKLHRAILYPL